MVTGNRGSGKWPRLGPQQEYDDIVNSLFLPHWSTMSKDEPTDDKMSFMVCAAPS